MLPTNRARREKDGKMWDKQLEFVSSRMNGGCCSPHFFFFFFFQHMETSPCQVNEPSGGTFLFKEYIPEMKLNMYENISNWWDA